MSAVEVLDQPSVTLSGLTKWDTKVALRQAYAEVRAAALSERFGVDVKKLRGLSGLKPRQVTTGALQALSRGVAVVDELGILRCPPGTPNAMEFTDFRGSNCGGGRAARKPVRLAIGEAREELDRRGIGVVSSVDLAGNRLGEAVVRNAPKGSRRRLAESVRQLVSPTPEGEPTGWQKAFKLLTIPNEGFSLDIDLGENAQSGFAIARPGRGIRVKADELLDENGDIKQEGALRLARMIAANAEDFTTPQEVTVNGKKYKAERVVLGAWRSPEDEYVYFDVSDVFPQDMDVADALQIGIDRNQQSIANLGQIAAENAERMRAREAGEEVPDVSWADLDDALNGATAGLLGTGGTGADLLPEEALRGVNPVRLGNTADELESVLRAIEGVDTLDLENFTPQQVATMLNYLKKAPGFDWIDPNDPEHLSLALLQLSDNLMNLMTDTTEDERLQWKRWYDIANTFNERLATELDLPSQTVHAITAAFSPQKDWDQNTAMSEHAIRLLGDKDYEVEPKVAALALSYALEQWTTRNTVGERGSHSNRIKQAEKEAADALRLVEKERDSLASHSSKKPTKANLENVEKARVRLENNQRRLAAAEAALAEARAAQEADAKPTMEALAGKKMADLNMDNAAAVVRAHGELEGGAYLGQPLAAVKTSTAEGASPRALLAYTTVIDPDAASPGDHSVIGNPDSRVRAQSMDVYRSVVNIFRSDGDMAIIDYELGEGAKVRSFYNNNAFPNDRLHRDTTIDTHAVAAELGIPIAASHDLTDLAFSNVTSLKTGQAYPLMRAAMIATALRWKEQTGEDLLPRQIQSITWEKMRALVPAKAKKYVADRAGQVQRLGGGPDGDPRFKGEAGYNALTRLYQAATVDLDEVNKGRRGKDKFTREELLAAVVRDLGLPPLKPSDILPKTKKKTSSTPTASGE